MTKTILHKKKQGLNKNQFFAKSKGASLKKKKKEKLEKIDYFIL
jgi:hypothetical protein